jgi:excisionase family DNA binding protein
MTDRGSDAWLSLDEAASRLGVSRLKVREAIAAGALSARRDNQGFWRVSLEAANEASQRVASTRLAPPQLVEILFDEVEETSASLAERNAEVEKLSALVARQQQTLDRAMRLLEAAEAAETEASRERLVSLNEKSHALLDRALTELEARSAELVKVGGLLDRAMGAAAGLDAEVARQTEVVTRQRALLDRLFAIAQAGLERVAGRSPSRWLSRWRGSGG